MNVLVFSPHPDDDLIGCGGSIIKHVQAGHHVSIIYMTSGNAGSRKYSKSELGTIREAEATEACKLLGVTDLYFLRNDDGYLEESRDNFVQVINHIRSIKPAVVYLPHEADGHPDHMMTHQIAMKAIGRASGPWFQETDGEPWTTGTILAYEVWTPLQSPNYFEDTTTVINQQIEALQQHKSQIDDIAYDQMVRGLGSYRGMMSGKDHYAEAFQVLAIPQNSIT